MSQLNSVEVPGKRETWRIYDAWAFLCEVARTLLKVGHFESSLSKNEFATRAASSIFLRIDLLSVSSPFLARKFFHRRAKLM